MKSSIMFGAVMFSMLLISAFVLGGSCASRDADHVLELCVEACGERGIESVGTYGTCTCVSPCR